MGFLSVLSYTQKLIKERLQPGEAAIDATLGTGADTLFLAKTVGRKGKVFGFDIQEEALQLTKDRLSKEDPASIADVTLLLKSHALMKEALPLELHGKIGAVMFNLGYLPVSGANQKLITLTDSTITALESSLDVLRPRGVITAVLYPGHKGGDQEASAVESWAANLPQTIAQSIIYRQLQRPNAPYLIALEKK
ncbi:class I SAM-dependent methyltransferase [Paenibacillus sediminis]|uniref:SAM-dependent methyltransferase n=1 Tax=Paenibacillus sediminis TaxID=664909 RepID=A0ABS4H4L8_9BACL|nr:class I SAM-dependent methyltransferase [Paenibacillus sediminis]MBP1937484.1 SAM-dependent methyltransferase [Paenibacillus sediminis]